MPKRFTWLRLGILLVGLMCWQPLAYAWSGGTGYLSNGPYDWVNSTFYYNVTGAPPNVCGTLHTFRNGSQLDSPGWICTNSSGNATMGPYSGSTNQTDENVYIEWPDGSHTNAIYHVSDASPPTIWINTYGTSFTGGASDVQWGTGFDFGPAAWSGITTSYQDLTTGKYWDGAGYNAINTTLSGGEPSDYFGFNISWSAPFPPPPSAHEASHAYRWCVFTGDRFYLSNIACAGFSGIP